MRFPVTDHPPIVVSKELVAKWRDEADELERRANRLRRKAIAGEQILQAEDAEEADRENWPDSPAPETPTEIVPNSFVGAIKFFANRSAAPLSRDALKTALIGAGFPPASVNGQYFTVALSNLKKHGSITIDTFGNVGKGAKS